MTSTAQEMIRFRPTGRCVLRHIGQDRLLVPVAGEVARSNAVFPLNESAAYIWERLMEEQSLEQIARAMTEQFDVDFEQALEDVRNCAAQLTREGLIQEVDHASAQR